MTEIGYCLMAEFSMVKLDKGGVDSEVMTGKEGFCCDWSGSMGK